MFQNFKLSFDVDILAFFGHFIQILGKIFINFLVTLEGEGLGVGVNFGNVNVIKLLSIMLNN
jgi:hypothetical protein